MTPTRTAARSPAELRRAWSEILEGEPGLRIRNAADRLEVSEAELLATRCGDDGVRRIRADVAAILPRLEELGELMALTRNDTFVHERTGVYRNVEVTGHAAQVVDEEIDLRIFPSRWRHAFAVEDPTRRGTRRSLQFFDAHGEAVHKVYLTEASRVDRYEELVEELLDPDQGPGLEVEARPAPDEPRPDEEVDVAALEEGWRNLRDTHDFFRLLRRHGVERTQALRLVSDELARPASGEALRTILERASSDGIDLMIFVQSPGTFQIHHGPVERIVATPPWLNVLDPRFNLHVLADGIHETWVVAKPTEAGWVTSVEMYDEAGWLSALFFGCREEGEPESPAWRALARGLPRPQGETG